MTEKLESRVDESNPIWDPWKRLYRRSRTAARSVNWFGVGLIGGVLFAVSGTEGMTSGLDRFKKLANCEKTLTSYDPLIYTLKNPTDVCVKLDQGVPAQELIAGFSRQAEIDRPWGITKLVAGTTIALGTLVIGFGPYIVGSRRREEAVSESSKTV